MLMKHTHAGQEISILCTQRAMRYACQKMHSVCSQAKDQRKPGYQQSRKANCNDEIHDHARGNCGYHVV